MAMMSTQYHWAWKRGEEYWHSPPAGDLRWTRVGQSYHHLTDQEVR